MPKNEEATIHEFEIAVDGGKPEILKFGDETIEVFPPTQTEKLSMLRILNLVGSRALKLAPELLDDDLKKKYKKYGSGKIDLDESQKESLALAFSEATQIKLMDDDVFGMISKFIRTKLNKGDSWLSRIDPADIVKIFQIIVDMSPFEKKKTPNMKDNPSMAFLTPFMK